MSFFPPALQVRKNLDSALASPNAIQPRLSREAEPSLTGAALQITREVELLHLLRDADLLVVRDRGRAVARLVEIVLLDKGPSTGGLGDLGGGKDELLLVDVAESEVL